MARMKMCFSTSNLFLIELVGGKRGEMRLIPSASGPRLPAATGHVWRSPGMGGITGIPKNSKGARPEPRPRRATTERPAWRM